jgi:hypothetical protein
VCESDLNHIKPCYLVFLVEHFVFPGLNFLFSSFLCIFLILFIANSCPTSWAITYVSSQDVHMHQVLQTVYIPEEEWPRAVILRWMEQLPSIHWNFWEGSVQHRSLDPSPKDSVFWDGVVEFAFVINLEVSWYWSVFPIPHCEAQDKSFCLATAWTECLL